MWQLKLTQRWQRTECRMHGAGNLCFSYALCKPLKWTIPQSGCRADCCHVSSFAAQKTQSWIQDCFWLHSDHQGVKVLGCLVPGAQEWTKGLSWCGSSCWSCFPGLSYFQVLGKCFTEPGRWLPHGRAEEAWSSESGQLSWVLWGMFSTVNLCWLYRSWTAGASWPALKWDPL